MSKVPVNRIFRAFSDPTRLRILHLLSGGELCVCDIVGVLGVPQPTASRHLAYLLRSGLIAKRKQGLWAYYKLAAPASPFHRSLITCLRECFRDVPELTNDAARASRLGICCQPARSKSRGEKLRC
jgi:ArsR family transcriptional regulator, arsenate/arsenite/antimonite-responsive transcriptional repressor